MTAFTSEYTININKLGSFSIGRAFWLQIAPGLASTAVFLPAAFLLSQAGLPPIFALGAGILLAEVPVSWWVMIREVRREQGRFSFSAAFPWMKKLRWSTYLLIGLPLVVISMALMMVGQMTVGEQIREAFFAAAPAWILMDSSTSEMVALGTPVLLAMFAMSLVIFTLIGGVTQELYARAFLMPRLGRLGLGAPLVSAVFFAMLHLAAPWNWPVFFAASLLWALAAYWTKSAKIAVFGHVGMLLLQTLMLGALVLAAAAGAVN